MKHRARIAVAAAVAVALTALLAACGGGDKGGASASPVAGNGTDLAFVSEMVPHHRSAIEMARIAQTRTTRPEIRALAGDIVAAQRREIAQLDALRAKLVAAGIEPGSLDVSQHGMGTSMDPAMLADAKPFDRAFIDMMTPHHRSAVTMARAELAKGTNPEARRIAEAIVAAQQREIAQMAKWREAWYGSSSGSGSMGM